MVELLQVFKWGILFEAPQKVTPLYHLFATMLLQKSHIETYPQKSPRNPKMYIDKYIALPVGQHTRPMWRRSARSARALLLPESPRWLVDMDREEEAKGHFLSS